MPYKDPVKRREKGLEYTKRWQANNPDKVKESTKKRDPKKLKEYQRRYKNNSPDKYKATRKRAEDKRRGKRIYNKEERRRTAKRYRKNNPLKIKKEKQNQKIKRRELIDSIKSVACMDCGKEYPPYVMHFDHVPERGKKEFTISEYFYTCSLDRLLKEIAKCDVVCANCHAERTHQRITNQNNDKMDPK